MFLVIPPSSIEQVHLSGPFSKLSMRSRQQRPGVISGSAAGLSNDNNNSSSPWWCFLLSVCLLCLLCFKCTSRQQRTPCWTHFLRSIEEMFVGGPLAILVSPFSSLYSSVCFSEFFYKAIRVAAYCLVLHLL